MNKSYKGTHVGKAEVKWFDQNLKDSSRITPSIHNNICSSVVKIDHVF